MQKNIVQFTKACRYEHEGHINLTPEYIQKVALSGKVVQINIDLNIIIEMENLKDDATLEDVEACGLKPLYDALHTGLVVMSCMGVNEAREKDISNKHDGYERFCEKFWPGNVTDSKATYRKYSRTEPQNTFNYWGLSDAERYIYGHTYISMMLIQDIRKNHRASEFDKFNCYLNGIIGMIDQVNGFETEIAKYAFWNPKSIELQNASENLRKRFDDIKANFLKKSSKKTILEHCLNATMDIMWLSGSALSEEMGNPIEIDGVIRPVENWLATLDGKLHRISRDMHSCIYEGSNVKRFATARDHEMLSFKYWTEVDQLSHSMLLSRSIKKQTEIDQQKKLKRIDKMVEEMESIFLEPERA